MKNIKIKASDNFMAEKSRKDLKNIFEKELTREEKIGIDKAVQKVVKEYGETLRLLGRT